MGPPRSESTRPEPGMTPTRSVSSWSELGMIQGIERMEALRREQVARRAAQDLNGEQVGPPPGDAAVQVMFPPLAAPSAAPSAAPIAGPSAGTSAAVQGGLPPVPMDEEDSLPSSVGSFSPEDYAALEGALGQCDDEPLILSESVSDHSMLSASEKKKALAAARAAEKKRFAAQKRRADKAAKIGNGVPANRGRTPTRGGGGGRRGGGGRAVSVLETHAQPAPAPLSPLPSSRVAFPLLHRAMSSSSGPTSPPLTAQQQTEQPAQSTSGMGRSEPQHSGEAGGSSDSLEVVVAEGQENAESVGPPQVPDQEAAQVAGHPLVPVQHVSLPSQDLQLASLQVRLTWFFLWCLCYSGFLFRSLVWWGWSAENSRGWTRLSLALSP